MEVTENRVYMKSFSSVLFNDLALFFYGATGFIGAGVIAGRVFPSMFNYTISDADFRIGIIFFAFFAVLGVFFRFLSNSIRR
jgi:hypothetical protein